MSDQSAPTPPSTDPRRLSAAMSRITEQSRRIMQGVRRTPRRAAPREFNPLEPAVVSRAYQALWQQMLTDPERLVEAQVSLWQDYAKLWENTARRLAGEDVEPAAAPEPGDRRFKDDAWSENPLYTTTSGRATCSRRSSCSPRCARRRAWMRHNRAQGGLLYPPVHRRPRADQFRDDEPRGGEAHGRNGRREPRAGVVEHARGSRTGDRGDSGSG